MVMSFLAVQRVELTCVHCAKHDVRLASAVKTGSNVTCAFCKRRFRVKELRLVVGTSARR